MIYKTILFCILATGFSVHSCELMIKVASSSDWPPYIFRSEDKKVGLEVDILRTVLDKTPFCIEYVDLPSLSRSLDELKYKRVDLLGVASFNQDRESFARFSLPYRKEKMVIFENSKNTNSTKSLVNQPNYLEFINHRHTFIAVHRGSYYGDVFNQFLVEFKGHTISTTLARQRFELLKKGRVDYVIEDELTGIYMLADNDYSENITNTKITVFSEDVYYMLRHGLMSDEQVALFNQAIVDSEIEIERLIEYYSFQ